VDDGTPPRPHTGVSRRTGRTGVDVVLDEINAFIHEFYDPFAVLDAAGGAG
jgi:hypothetical protein